MQIGMRQILIPQKEPFRSFWEEIIISGIYKSILNTLETSSGKFFE